MDSKLKEGIDVCNIRVVETEFTEFREREKVLVSMRFPQEKIRIFDKNGNLVI